MSLNFFIKRENNSRSEKKKKNQCSKKHYTKFQNPFHKTFTYSVALNCRGDSFYNFGDFCTLISLNYDSPSL